MIKMLILIVFVDLRYEKFEIQYNFVICAHICNKYADICSYLLPAIEVASSGARLLNDLLSIVSSSFLDSLLISAVYVSSSDSSSGVTITIFGTSSGEGAFGGTVCRY